MFPHCLSLCCQNLFPLQEWINYLIFNVYFHHILYLPLIDAGWPILVQYYFILFAPTILRAYAPTESLY